MQHAPKTEPQRPAAQAKQSAVGGEVARSTSFVAPHGPGYSNKSLQRVAGLQGMARQSPATAGLRAMQQAAEKSSAVRTLAGMHDPSTGDADVLQRISYDEAHGGLAANKKDALTGWVRASTDSTKKDVWDGFLKDMSLEDIGKKLEQAPLQEGIATPPASRPALVAIQAMSLGDLHAHANDQLDWDVNPALDDAARGEIRKILFFARTDGGAALGACGRMTVSDLRTELAKDGDAIFGHLNTYVKSVTAGDPITLPRQNDAKPAIKVGVNLQKLQAGFGTTILKGALPTSAYGRIHNEHLVDDVIDYYTNVAPTPIFQAKNGSDFDSYWRMQQTDTKNPKDYAGTGISAYVRNYHRFTKLALDRLGTNLADTSKALPLTLILHSSIDKNGAFHRDPNLDAVITNGNMLTLMVEGAETLDDVIGMIGPLARTYGRRDKIDQVMIAGHGNFRTIQLAGKLLNGGELDDNDKLKEDSDAVDVGTAPAKAKLLFDEILSYMDADANVGDKFMGFFGKAMPATEPHKRILFNACLTASNYITVTLDKDPGRARAQIRDFLRGNKNLVETVRSETAAQSRKEVSVKGSVASHGRLTLTDASDNLDLVSLSDPHLTSSKIDYVRHGTEPVGVMRALLECWSSNSSSARAALGQIVLGRIALNSTTWRLAVIERCLDVASRNWGNATVLKYLSFIAGELSHAHSSTGCTVGQFKNTLNTGSLGEFVLSDLTKAADWVGVPRIPLVIYQVRILLAKNAAAKDLFVNQLGAHFDCATAREFVDLGRLGPHMSTLLNGGGSDKGKLVLALMGALDNDGPSKTHLLKVLDVRDPPHNNSFDPALNIATLLAGRSTEDRILVDLGRKADPLDMDIGLAIDPTREGNVSPRGETDNTVFMRSVTWKGKVKAGGASAFEKPDGAKKAGDLAENQVLNINGADKLWLAVSHTYPAPGTAFVLRAKVDVTHQ